MQTALFNPPTEEPAWHIFHPHSHLRTSGWCTSDKLRGIHLSTAEISEVNSIIHRSDVLLEMFWMPDLSFPPISSGAVQWKSTWQIRLKHSWNIFSFHLNKPAVSSWRKSKSENTPALLVMKPFGVPPVSFPPPLSMILHSIYGRKGHFYNGREVFPIDLSGYWIPLVLFFTHTHNKTLFSSPFRWRSGFSSSLEQVGFIFIWSNIGHNSLIKTIRYSFIFIVSGQHKLKCVFYVDFHYWWHEWLNLHVVA